jgi:hypothetical protein
MLFVLAAGGLAFALGMVLLIAGRTWRTAVIAFALALLPLMVGTAGTLLGYQQTDAVIEHLAPDGTVENPEELRQVGYATARITTWFGALLSAGLLVACLGVLMLKPARRIHPSSPCHSSSP